MVNRLAVSLIFPSLFHVFFLHFFPSTFKKQSTEIWKGQEILLLGLAPSSPSVMHELRSSIVTAA